MQALKTIKGDLVTVTSVSFHSMGHKPWVVLTAIDRQGKELTVRSNGEGLVLDIEDAVCSLDMPFDARFEKRNGHWTLETE